jgi:glyoxylase-like metal-dependent hydrolase (beta-lactamase superfamily II)
LTSARLTKREVWKEVGVEVTGTAQFDAWRRRQVPPVEALRPDLWSIPVPIPDNPLRYVSVYALALDEGIGLIDTGWESDPGWGALISGLAVIGATVADVRGVLITHMHFDHLGLAARVRRESGAWIAMHPADAAAVLRWNQRDGASAVAAQIQFLIRLGADRSEAEEDAGHPEAMERFTRMAAPDRLLEDNDLADFPGWQLRALHTPGHTPGHLCFQEDRTGLFFSGDHVLPRISPNISTDPDGDTDPLRSYLHSLAAVRDLAPTEVLPAHEWRFRGLAERTDQLALHHEHRLSELLQALREHPGSTPWQVAAHLTWSRPWPSYTRQVRIFAVTETDAHLRLLRSRGMAISSDAAVPTWSAVAR